MNNSFDLLKNKGYHVLNIELQYVDGKIMPIMYYWINMVIQVNHVLIVKSTVLLIHYH